MAAPGHIHLVQVALPPGLKELPKMTPSLRTVRFPQQRLWMLQAREPWFSHIGVHQNDPGASENVDAAFHLLSGIWEAFAGPGFTSLLDPGYLWYLHPSA